MNPILLAGIVLATFISTCYGQASDDLGQVSQDLIAKLRKKRGVDQGEIDKLESHLQQTQASLNSLQSSDPDKYGKAKTAVSAVSGELGKLLSGNGTDMLEGALNVLMAGSEILPDPAGLIVGSIASLALAVFGFSSEEPSMSTVMDQMFEKHLTLSKMQNLRARFWGAKRVLADTRAKAVLYTIHEKEPTETDLTILGIMLSREGPMQMLGTLQSYFLEDAKAARTEQAAKNAVELVKLYVKLSILNQGVLRMIRPVFEKSEHSEVESSSIKYQLDVAQRMDKDFLKPIFEEPDFDMALVPLMYQHDPVVTKYLDSLGIDPWYTNSALIATKCLHFVSVFGKHMRGFDDWSGPGEEWLPTVEGDTDLYYLWLFFTPDEVIDGYSKPLYPSVKVQGKSGDIDTDESYYLYSNPNAEVAERYLDLKEDDQSSKFRFVIVDGNGHRRLIFSNAQKLVEPFMAMGADQRKIYPAQRGQPLNLQRNTRTHWDYRWREECNADMSNSY